MTYHVLAIHDVEVPSERGMLMWAYARRTAALVKYAPSDFHVERCQHADIPWHKLSKFDLIFHLDYTCPMRGKIKRHAPNALYVLSYNKDQNSVTERWRPVYEQADFVVVNNRAMWEHVGRPPRTCNISNGVCTETFRSTVPISKREHRVFWRGSSTPRKGKNWQTVLEPAIPRLKELGFVPDFQPVNEIVPEQVLTTEELVRKYNECSYVVCAATSEGTPCTSLEGMACGCVLVSTPVGNVREFGVHGENCAMIDPTPESLIEGLLAARERLELLSYAGMKLMHRQWSYGPPGNRAELFFSLFRALISGRTTEPFSYMDAGGKFARMVP